MSCGPGSTSAQSHPELLRLAAQPCSVPFSAPPLSLDAYTLCVCISPRGITDDIDDEHDETNRILGIKWNDGLENGFHTRLLRVAFRISKVSGFDFRAKRASLTRGCRSPVDAARP